MTIRPNLHPDDPQSWSIVGHGFVDVRLEIGDGTGDGINGGIKDGNKN